MKEAVVIDKWAPTSIPDTKTSLARWEMIQCLRQWLLRSRWTERPKTVRNRASFITLTAKVLSLARRFHQWAETMHTTCLALHKGLPMTLVTRSPIRTKRCHTMLSFSSLQSLWVQATTIRLSKWPNLRSKVLAGERPLLSRDLRCWLGTRFCNQDLASTPTKTILSS